MIEVVRHPNGRTHMVAHFTEAELAAIYEWHDGKGKRKRGRKSKRSMEMKFGIQ